MNVQHKVFLALNLLAHTVAFEPCPAGSNACLDCLVYSESVELCDGEDISAAEQRIYPGGGGRRCFFQADKRDLRLESSILWGSGAQKLRVRGLRGPPCPMLMWLCGSHCSPCLNMNGCLGRPRLNFSPLSVEVGFRIPSACFQCLKRFCLKCAILQHPEELYNKLR